MTIRGVKINNVDELKSFDVRSLESNREDFKRGIDVFVKYFNKLPNGKRGRLMMYTNVLAISEALSKIDNCEKFWQNATNHRITFKGSGQYVDKSRIELLSQDHLFSELVYGNMALFEFAASREGGKYWHMCTYLINEIMRDDEDYDFLNKRSLEMVVMFP